jgi:hypothetical protein
MKQLSHGGQRPPERKGFLITPGASDRSWRPTRFLFIWKGCLDLCEPIFQDQSRRTGQAREMFLIVGDERGVLVQGDAGDLQVQIADELAGALELCLKLAKAPAGPLIVG